ncbi:MAG: hypothetical protein ACK5U8_14695, partial [Deltaproteobacteria bacterium]
GFGAPAQGGGFGAPAQGGFSAPASTGGGGDPGGGRPWGKYIGIGCGVMFLLSCLAWGGCYACNSCAASAVNQAAQQAQQEALEQAATGTTPAAAPAGGGGVCGRAAECCTAYVDTIVAAQNNPMAQAMAASLDQVRQTCASYTQAAAAGAAAEPGCQSAIDGYRTGLSAVQLTVPTACQ